ncbi:MAG: nuclear transport factor 2 family protein [Gemmatimonadota bacterium]
MRILTVTTAASVVAALAACSHAASSPAAPSPQRAPATLSAAQIAARQTLLSADSALSLAASRSLHEAIAGGAAGDVVMLMPSLARVGTRDSVLATLDSLNAATNRTLSWRPIRAELSADGTRGYTYGYGRRVARTDTLTSVVPIQYLSFWRREANDWKLVAWLISAGGADAPATAPEACAHPSPPEYVATNDSGAAASARTADLDFSALSKKSGAGEAFGQFVAADGASIGSGASEVVCGRDAVAKGVAGLTSGALTWAPRVADAAPSGDLAFTSGDAIIHIGQDTRYSNYLTVWKRQADGKWRFVADGGNSAPAPRTR